MKKSIMFLALLLAGSHYAKCQSTFTLPEIEKLCSYSASAFETHILQRGYSLQSNFSTDETKIYWCDEKRIDGRQDQISRTTAPLIPNIIMLAQLLSRII